MSKKHELEEVKNVGEKTRAVLVEGGVKTVADLANSTVKEIESILESKVHASTRTGEKIGEMIQDAKAIVAAQQKDVAQTDSASAESQLATPLEFNVEFFYGDIMEGQQKWWQARIRPHGIHYSEPLKWLPYPGLEIYTVRFEQESSEDNQKRWQTYVSNAQSYEEETEFTGMTPDDLLSWIAEKAPLTEEALQATTQGEENLESELPSVDDKPAVTGETQAEKALRITRFEVHLPSEKRANTLVADVDFEISDELLAEQFDQVQVEVLYVNLDNNDSKLAGSERKNLKPEQRKYDSQFVFTMPELGRYLPHCIVLVLPSGEHADYQGDSIFNVVPKKQDV